jgi:ribosomal protein S1
VAVDDQNGTIPQAADDPGLWARIRAEVDVGLAVTGTVICRRPFGVFLDIGYGSHAPALLLIPEFAQARSQRIEFDDFPNLGAVVNAQVLYIDWDRQKIALTQNPTFDPDNRTWNVE